MYPVSCRAQVAARPGLTGYEHCGEIRGPFEVVRLRDGKEIVVCKFHGIVLADVIEERRPLG